MKVKIGDIVEVQTSAGLAYALYAHRHSKPPKYGAMIRVFQQIYASRPTDVAEVTTDRVRFTTFFPLQAAVDKHLVEIVGNVPVPEHLQTFPLFRVAGLANPQTKRVDNWWLWDGETEWRIGTLSQEQRKLQIRGVWNYTLLVEQIVHGWCPENDRR